MIHGGLRGLVTAATGVRPGDEGNGWIGEATMAEPNRTYSPPTPHRWPTGAPARGWC
jgi:hypothetical protein